MAGMSSLCGCGCGAVVNAGRRFRQGHWAKTAEGREIRRNCQLGRKLPMETRAKMSAAHMGHGYSEKTKAALNARNRTGWQKTVGHKISRTLTGHVQSKATKLKRSLSMRGSKNPNWKGGNGREYPEEWSWAARETRKRDGGLCLSCGTGVYQAGHRSHDVHHIDANKQNCAFENLITLCRSCHTTADYYLDRSIPRFRSILFELYGYSYA